MEDTWSPMTMKDVALKWCGLSNKNKNNEHNMKVDKGCCNDVKDDVGGAIMVK
jgi:hypothetical protein